MLTTALETGEGPGRRQVTAGQPTSDDLAWWVAISFSNA